MGYKLGTLAKNGSIILTVNSSVMKLSLCPCLQAPETLQSKKNWKTGTCFFYTEFKDPAKGTIDN